MKTWKGLWKKEWQMMRGWLSATTVIAILLIIVSSSALSFLVEGKLVVSFMLGISLMMMTLIVVCVPVSLLLNSLWIEWKRPDVWLHSPQTIYQLFGCKTVFASVIGFVSMIVPGVTLALYASIFDASITEVGVAKFIGMMYTFISSVFLGAVGLMLIGLFLAVVYRVIKSYVRRGAFFIWLVVLFILMWLFQSVLESKLYQKIVHLGQLSTYTDSRDISVGNFYFAQSSMALYAGQIFVVVGFLAFLFVSSAWLFEKKVRL